MAKRIVFSKKAFIDIDRIIEFNNRKNLTNTYSRKFWPYNVLRGEVFNKKERRGLGPSCNNGFQSVEKNKK